MPVMVVGLQIGDRMQDVDFIAGLETGKTIYSKHTSFLLPQILVNPFDLFIVGGHLVTVIPDSALKNHSLFCVFMCVGIGVRSTSLCSGITLVRHEGLYRVPGIKSESATCKTSIFPLMPEEFLLAGLKKLSNLG